MLHAAQTKSVVHHAGGRSMVKVRGNLSLGSLRSDYRQRRARASVVQRKTGRVTPKASLSSLHCKSRDVLIGTKKDVHTPSVAQKAGRTSRSPVAPSSHSPSVVGLTAVASVTTEAKVPGKASVLQKVFHIVAFIQTFSVWFWHFTPASSYLPAWRLYGFFFRYLTFCTYTLQTIYLGSAIISDFTDGKKFGAFKLFSGRLAGMAFAMTNVVTVMYYGVMQQFPAPIEGSNVDRPPFLNLAVHCINAIIGWGDLLITNNMNLSKNVLKMTYLYATLYTSWMQHIKMRTGLYPYPFLDKLPFPIGPIAITAIAFVAVLAFFKIGNMVRNTLRGRDL